MKLKTRILLLNKDYRHIENEDKKTLDKIWQMEKIPLVYRIDICIRNNYLEKLKEVTSEQLKELLQKVSPAILDEIILIMHEKKDYTLIPEITSKIEKENQQIEIEEKLKRKISKKTEADLLFLMKCTINIEKEDKESKDQSSSFPRSAPYWYTLYEIIKKSPDEFISLLSSSEEIKKNFLLSIESNESYIKDSFLLMNKYPPIEDYFCKKHPELFFNKIFRLENKSQLREWNILCYDNLFKYLKEKDKPLIAYYSVMDSNRFKKVLQESFTLEEEDLNYLIGQYCYSNNPKEELEYLLKQFQNNKEYIRTIAKLQTKFKINNIIPLVIKYSDTTIIKQLIELDEKSISKEKIEMISNKLKQLLKSQKIKGLDNLEKIIDNDINQLAKQGYVITPGATQRPKTVDGRYERSDKWAFKEEKLAIKIDEEGKIKKETGSLHDDHSKLFYRLCEETPQLYDTYPVKTCTKMTLYGYIILYVETTDCLVYLPSESKLTREQLISLITLIREEANEKSTYHYGIIYDENNIECIDDLTKEEILQKLEIILSQLSTRKR